MSKFSIKWLRDRSSANKYAASPSCILHFVKEPSNFSIRSNYPLKCRALRLSCKLNKLVSLRMEIVWNEAKARCDIKIEGHARTKLLAKLLRRAFRFVALPSTMISRGTN